MTLGVAYLVTIPAGCLFAFIFNMGVVGLICGSAISHVLLTILFSCLILSEDWDQISQRSVNRIKEEIKLLVNENDDDYYTKA